MANRKTDYKPFPIYDYVIDSLNNLNRGGDLHRVQKDTGIKRWTMMKIAIKQIPNPGIKSIETLYHYFKAREGKDLRQRQQ
jgi:DNA-binding phage protein